MAAVGSGGGGRLQSLELQDNGIWDRGVAALAAALLRQAVSGRPTLRRLDLRANTVGTPGLEALAEAASGGPAGPGHAGLIAVGLLGLDGRACRVAARLTGALAANNERLAGLPAAQRLAWAIGLRPLNARAARRRGVPPSPHVHLAIFL